MSMFLGFFGIVLLAGIVVGWYWLHRRIKGTDGPLFGRPSKDLNRDSSTVLEAFIAAYRSGKLNTTEPPPGTEARPAVQPAASRVSPRPAPQAPPATATPRGNEHANTSLKLRYIDRELIRQRDLLQQLNRVRAAAVASAPIVAIGVFYSGLGPTAGASLLLSIGALMTIGGLGWGGTLTRMTISQVAPILPYLFLVLILIFRPKGLLGTREG